MANGAYSFDGQNDGISYSNISAINGASKLSVSFWVYPIDSTFYDFFLAQIGATTTGSGNTDGFAIQQNSNDATSVYLAFRNASGGPEKITNSGVLTLNAWNHIHVAYDGTQGTATNRLRLWVNGTEITSWASDTANFPTTLGTNNQPFAVAYDTDRTSHANPPGDGAGYDQCKIADLALFLGQAITNGTTISAMAAGMSSGNYVTTGDFWASFRVNQNDEKSSRTGTLVDSPTLTTGPSLTYPGSGTTYFQNVGGTITPTGSLVWTLSRALAGTVTSAGAPAKQTQRRLTGSIASAGALVRQTLKALSGTATSAGALVRRVSRTVTGTIASSGTPAKQTNRSLTGGVTPAGALSKFKVSLVNLAGSIASAGSLVRQTLTLRGGTVAPTGSVSKRTARAEAGTISSAGAVSASRLSLRSVGGSIAPAGTLARLPMKALGGVLAPAGSLLKRVARSLAGVVGLSGLLDAEKIGGQGIEVPPRRTFRVAAGSKTFAVTGRNVFTVPLGTKTFTVED